MPKLSTIEHTKTHRVLVYGDSKTGKTELAGRLAAKYNLVWFDLENGYETLLKLPTDYKEKIDLIRLPDTRVFPIAIETMLKAITGNKVSICEQHGKVSCALCRKDNLPVAEIDLNSLNPDSIVVIDSLTQLANSAMAHITKNQEDTYKPTWEDFRVQGALMDKFLSQVQQARFNICCLTHVVETTTDDNKKKLVPMAGTTNFSRNTAKYFDHVVYAELLNKSHRFGSSTTYSISAITGSRTDIVIENAKEISLLPFFSNDSKVNAEVAALPTQGQVATTNLQERLAKLKSGGK